MIAATSTEIVNGAALKQEERILSTVREHLRHARHNSAIGKIVFEFEIVRGGVGKTQIETVIRHRYLENISAV